MKQSQGKREDTMPSQATSRRNRMNSRSAPSSAHRSSSGKRVSERRQARLVTEMKRHVKMTYPDLQNRPYFIPPIHFNVSKRKHTPDTNGCYQAEKTPESNSRADEACERVLEVLKEALASRPVFVLSGITFEDYLNKRVPAARAGQAGGGSAQPVPIPLPRSADLPPQYRRGEVEMLVIDKDHGILIVDVKAVGDTFKEMKSNDSEKVEMISKVLEKALILMTKSKDVLLHLVSDIPATIPVKVMLVLPNLSKATLQNTLDKHSHLGEALGRCMEVGGPLTEACLCAEDLPLKHQPPTDHNVTHLADCWNRLYPRGQQVIDDDVYETIIGRFCGPFSTISVWTAQLPRREVRTLGQAVNETADRFATLLLLPQQQEVLKSEEPRVYLWGPPGAGKTLVLALKGIQWALEGAHVCVLTAKAGPSPIALVICKQIQKTLNQYHPNMDLGNVTTDNILIDQDVRRRDGTSLVGRLKAAAEGRPLGLILDEVHGEVLPYIRMLCAQLPAACRFWTSGPWPSSCPSGFAAHKLTTSVRCPPAVQALLKLTEPSGARSHGDGSEVTLERTTQYRYVTRGTMIDQYPLPTSGVPVTLLSHAGHGGEVPVLQCRLCAEALADHLLELGLGKDIQAQDVLILTADTDLVHQGLLASCTFVQVLQDQGFSLDVISDFPGCQERLAFPTNKITVTSYQFVTGLERSLVVFVPEGTSSDNSVASHVQVACDDDDSNSSTPQRPQNEVQFDAAELESIAPGNATPVLAPEGRHMEHREQDAPRNQAYHDEMGAEENGEVVEDSHQEKGQGTDQDKTEGIFRENMQDVCREDREKEVCQDISEKDRLENREKNRQEVSSSKTQEVRHENKEKSREVCEENQHEVSLNDRTDVCHENVEDSREEVRQKDMQEVCQENRPMVTEVNGHDVNHERKEGPIQTRRRDEQEKQTTGELDHQGNCSEDTHGDVNLNRQQVTQHSEHSASHGDRDCASENPAADGSRRTESAGVPCLGKDSGGPAATMTAQGGKQTNFTRYGTLSNSDEYHANNYYNENHSLTKPPVRDLQTEHMDRELHDEERKDVNNATAVSTDSISSDNEQQFENRIQYDEVEGDSYIDIIDTIGNYSSGYDSDDEDNGRHSKTEDRPRKSPRDSYRTRRGGHIPRSVEKAYHLAVQQANAGDCYEVDCLFSEPCSPNPVRVLETDEENDADGLEQKAEDDTLDPTSDPDDQQSVSTVTTQSPNHVDQSPQHAAAASEGSGLRPVTVQSLNSKLLAAVNSLSITNRENMWFSVSRSLGHCVVFHFDTLAATKQSTLLTQLEKFM